MNKRKVQFLLNNTLISSEVNPSLPLLDFIRKEKHLTGTKEVCKEGDCGACTVLLGTLTKNRVVYKTITSCIYPIANCRGKHVVTIEGINKEDLLLQQEIFADENASQCGFCTPGFLMSVTCYLLNNSDYTIEDAINAVGGNICRCTGYHSIIRALNNIIYELKNSSSNDRVQLLVDKNVIPDYFKEIKERLSTIQLDKKVNTEKSNLFISGGSDLFVQKSDMLLEEEAQFLSEYDLSYIYQNYDTIIIGSGTTFEEIKQSPILSKVIPTIKNDIDLVASLPIRNSATIGGNLTNASPIGDLTIILMALNSELVLTDGINERIIKLSDFYLDYKKLIKTNAEYIKEVLIQVPKGELKYSFEKVSKRTYLDIASVNSAMLIEVDGNKIINIFISAGGVAPVPKLLKETNQYLIGKDISIDTIDSALAVMQNEISPISDVRGSAEYKKILLGQLVKAHFLKLFPQLINEKEIV